MKVSVIIPTLNGSRFLEPCLDALRETRLPPGAELEAIVVDNGSSDDTAELLARYPQVKALFFPRPLGFARANNAARDSATGDLICFLNNDTQVEPEWAERPLQIFAQDAAVTGVGSKLLYMHRYLPVRFSAPVHADVRLLPQALQDKVRRSADGQTLYVPLPVPGIDTPLAVHPVVRVLQAQPGTTVTAGKAPARALERFPALVAVDPRGPSLRLIQNAGNFINERCEGGDVGSGEEDLPGRYDKEEVVPAICGAALWARRSALDAAGWFPAYYTVYYEDVDLCLRLRSRGGTLIFCPSSRVSHYHTGTNREHSSQFVESVARSSLLFAGRYGGTRTIARTLAQRVGDARRELVHGNGWAAAAGTRGFLSALAALPRPLSSRVRDRLTGAAAATSLTTLRRRPYLEPR
jgi:GT2 family glycosyltransferase